MTLSLLTIKDVGYEKKEDEEIKEAYPKEVCHMLKRHVRKKKIKKRKMHTQRRYATCPQGMSKRKKKER